MTLHQLTHAAGIELDFSPADLIGRLTARVHAFLAARRLDAELAALDHREVADLTWRR